MLQRLPLMIVLCHDVNVLRHVEKQVYCFKDPFKNFQAIFYFFIFKSVLKYKFLYNLTLFLNK